MSERFHILFRGQTVEGMEPTLVKMNLGRLFKSGPQQIDKLFTGKPVALKRDLDPETAAKYFAILKKTGAVCELVNAETLEQQDTGIRRAVEPNIPKKSPVAASASSSEPMESSQVEVIEAAPPPTAEVVEEDWSVAPAGSILKEAAAKPVPPSPDLSELSLAPTGADLIDNPTKPVPPEVDLSELSMAPLGSNMSEK